MGETDQQLCSYHPVIVGSSVLVVTRERLCCWDLATGRAVSWSGNEAGQMYSTAPPTRLHPLPVVAGLRVPRFSLTVSGSHVFLLMPVAAAERPAPSEHDPREPADRSGPRSTGQAAVHARRTARPRVVFDGPVVDGDDVYVCLWEQAAVPAMHVACLRGGRWQWMRRVGHGHPLAAETEIGRTHHLLTLAGDTLYVHADLGAVAAISKWDGQLKWVTRYPRRLCRSTICAAVRGTCRAI